MQWLEKQFRLGREPGSKFWMWPPDRWLQLTGDARE